MYERKSCDQTRDCEMRPTDFWVTGATIKRIILQKDVNTVMVELRWSRLWLLQQCEDVVCVTQLFGEGVLCIDKRAWARAACSACVTTWSTGKPLWRILGRKSVAGGVARVQAAAVKRRLAKGFRCLLGQFWGTQSADARVGPSRASASWPAPAGECASPGQRSAACSKLEAGHWR